MNNRKEYFKRYREEHKEHIREYKKEYYKTHDSSFKKLQIKNKDLQQRIDKAIRMLEINIEITMQQPSENKLEDDFILSRYKDLLLILKGENKKC